jgi:hypothetical protein
MAEIENQIETITANSPAVQAAGVASAVAEKKPVTTLNSPRQPTRQLESPDQGAVLTSDALVGSDSGYANQGLPVRAKLRDPSGSEGDPFYLTERFKDVVPFDTLFRDIPVKSTTIDEDKLAWELATSIEGKPDMDYFGYYRLPDEPTDSWLGELTKGLINTTGYDVPWLIGQVLVGGTGLASGLSGLLGWKEMAADLDLKTQEYIKATDQIGKDVVDWLDVEPFKARTTMGNIFNGVGSVIASIGLAAATRNPKMIASTFAVMAAAKTWENMTKLGYSPEAKLGGSALIGGAIRGLDASFGIFKAIGRHQGTRVAVDSAKKLLTESGVLGKTANTALKTANKVKNSAAFKLQSRGERLRTALGQSALVGLGDAVTEPLQDIVEGIGAGEIKSWEDVTDRATQLAITAAASFIGSSAGSIGIEIDNARKKNLDNIVEAAGLSVSARNWLVGVNKVFDGMVNDGITTTDKRNDFIGLLANPASLQFIKDNVHKAAYGQLDKIPLIQQQEFAKRMKATNIDSLVEDEYVQLKKHIDDAIAKSSLKFKPGDIDFIKGLYLGFSNIALFVDGTMPSKLDVNTFEPAGFGLYGFYSPRRNAIGVNVGATASKKAIQKNSEFDQFLQKVNDARDQDISARHSTIMHEFTHLMNKWIQKRTGDAKVGEYISQMNQVIHSIFGSDKQYWQAWKKANAKKQASDYSHPLDFNEKSAQAVGRAGRNALKALGLSDSKFARYQSYLNLMLNGMEKQGIYLEALSSYNDAFKSLMKENSNVVVEIAKKYGAPELAAKLRAFVNQEGMENGTMGLDPADILALTEAMKGFLDQNGLAALAEATEGVDTDELIQKGDFYLNRGIKAGMVDQPRKKTPKAERPNAKGEPAALLPTDPNLPTAMGINDPKKESPFEVTISTDAGNQTFAADKALVKAIESVFPNAKSPKKFYGLSTSDDKFVKKHPSEVKTMIDAALQQLGLPPDTKVYGLGVGENLNNEKGDMAYLADDMVAEEANEKKKSGLPEGLMGRINNTVVGRGLKQTIDFITDKITTKNKDGKTKNPWYSYLMSKSWIGNINQKLWALGGKDLVNEYGIVQDFQVLDDTIKNMHEQFNINLRDSLGMKDNKGFSLKRNMIEEVMANPRVEVNAISVLDPNMVKPMKLDGFQMAYLYLMNKQEASRERMQLAIKEDINEVLKKIKPEEIKYADALAKAIRESYQTYKTSLKDSGINLGFVEDNYYPILDAFSASYARDSIISTIGRNEASESMIALADVRSVFNYYAHRVGAAKSGVYQKLARLKDALQFVPNTDASQYSITPDEVDMLGGLVKDSANLRDKVKGVLGERGLENFIKAIDDFIDTKVRDIVANDGLSKVIRTITVSNLAWNPLSFVKNLTNIMIPVGFSQNKGAYLSNFTEGLAHPKETIKFMTEIDGVRHRYNGLGIDEHVTAVQTSEGGLGEIAKWMSKNNKGGSYSMAMTDAIVKSFNGVGLKLFMQSGDNFAIIFGMYPLVVEYMNQGMTKEEAGLKAMEFISESQSSSNRGTKNLVQRQMNRSVIGNFIAYTGEQVAKFGAISKAIAQVVAGESTVGEATWKILPIVAAQLAYIFVAAGLTDLFDDDDEVRAEAKEALWRETISQTLGFNIFGNNFLSPIAMNMMGYTEYGINAPIFSFLTDSATAVRKGDVEKIAANTLTVFAGMVGTGRLANILEGVTRLPSDEKGIAESGMRMMLGRSERFAEKRSGVKKPVEKKEK